MKVYNLEQKSSDWLAWRRKGIGGSDAPVLWHGTHWGRTVHDLWLDKVGRSKAKKTNSAMARGNRLEPVARAKYEQLMGFTTSVICVCDDAYEWCKGSLDGWVEQHKLVVEIKAPNRDHHLEALRGLVPEMYQPQLDHLLLATGGRLAHYVSYNDYFAPLEQLVVVVWPRDETRLAELFRKEKLFQWYVDNDTPPPADWDAKLNS